MAHYNPTEAFETLKQRVADTVTEQFPIEGKKNSLLVKKVWVDDARDINDIRSQQESKLRGRTWAVPLRAELELKDNVTGKVKDRQTVTLAQIPKITDRYTYIVNGNEYQVSNQFRLKSGVYTQIKQNGKLASQWNLAQGHNFNMDFDPKSKKMSIKFSNKGSNIALYPILKTMGVDDDTIERAWGKEVLDANKKGNQTEALRKFHKTFAGEMPDSISEAEKTVVEEFGRTKLLPESTKVTLGTAYDSVSGKALLSGSHKILRVSRQEEEPDDRDSLEFKELHSAEDLIAERISKKHRWDVRRKISNTLDKSDKKVKDIVHPDIFGKPVKAFFTSSDLSEIPDQMNPMSYIAGNRRTTIRGEGGISKAEQVTASAKAINPSHLGFLDPIQTPESSKIGTTLQLALGVEKKGRDILARAYDAKTGKRVKLTPTQVLHSVVAYPDQYSRESGKLVPIGSRIKATGDQGQTTVVKPSEVDYVLASPKGMFDLSSNLIPFLQSDQGNRTMVAAKQIEQAVSLTDREAPMVQVKSEGKATFEELVGGFSSHLSPVGGKVAKVTSSNIIIKGDDGKRHEIQLYSDFPMNDDKSFLTSEPLVEKGQKVTPGQVLADTNFTSNGRLALGKNLRVAYMPWKGYNFEDGIVISETAAKKLTSSHMFRESVKEEKDTTILDKKKFVAEMGAKLEKKKIDKLDDRAIIRTGERVETGDVLIGVMKHEYVTPEQKQVGLFSKQSIKPVKSRPVTWDKDIGGTVSRVVTHGGTTTVYVKADAPADIGDKIVGRHGNKGIITKILPDGEMPKTDDDRPAEVLLNPTGVPTRINLGQVLETAAGKIAEKTGKPYIVSNFDPKNKDYTRNLAAELKKHGISDTEDMTDPATGRVLKDVLIGTQYIYKLHHTAAKGLSVRSRHAYDSNMTPQKGGTQGAQTMDAMGLYAMLAHNARENVREMQTYKADKNDDFWTMLQAGEAPPAPKVPFVFKKFEGYLKTMGIDIDKEGNDLLLRPITDAQVRKMSNGALPRAGRTFTGRNMKPEKGGIFDPVITGTKNINELGDKWSHIELAEQMPNPIFEKPVRNLLELSGKDYNQIVESKQELDGKTGPKAIVSALRKLDVAAKEKELSEKIGTLRGANRSKANKQLKYIRSLRKAGLTPESAYTTKVIPVLPPVMRPAGILPNGSLNIDDVNKLYSRIANTNDQLSMFDPKVLPDEEAYDLRTAMYDGLKALALTGHGANKQHLNSVSETIAGKGRPKKGYFQDKIIGKRQDLSMRGTIVPEPSISLDEVGMPRKAAKELYKPFVVQNLVRSGMTPFQAQQAVKENEESAMRALEYVLNERPILLKRDPVLHKFGVQAFRPKVIEGKAIKIHPLATSGYNADFDGDKMSAYVPVSSKAIDEARKMFPSHNLFNPATGRLMFKPTHESMLGLYKMTEVNKKAPKRFKTVGEAARAVNDGHLDMKDPITVDLATIDADILEKFGERPVTTTVGRILVNQALPPEKRDKKILTDPKFILDKKNLHDLLTDVAVDHDKEFAHVADKVKDLGNKYSTGLSISLKDLFSDKRSRDPVLAAAAKEEDRIRKDSRLSNARKAEKVVEIYSRAGKLIDKRSRAKADANPTRLYDWVRSGARGSWDQYKQMTVTPLLVQDSAGKTVPVPIDRSYSEGLDIGSYWASMHGARMGTINRVEGTWRPGYMGKQIMQTTMNQMIVSEDCGTTKGIKFPSGSRDILGRVTVGEIKLGKGGRDKGVIANGTLVTPDVARRLRNNKIADVRVRSPLKCAHGKGLCSKCYGLNENGAFHPKGVNVGIIAAQALGEPATQLSMNAFHTGGVAGAKGSSAVGTFDRLDQLLQLPKVLPGAATLATTAGKVQKVQKDPAGGWSVFVEGQRHYVPGTSGLMVKRNQSVKKGDALSTGPKNPREMRELVGMNHVQSYLVNEIQRVYEKEAPIRRINTETFVRSMTNLSEVRDPGSNDGLLPGDKVPTSEIVAYNSKMTPDKQIKYDPLLQGVKHLPVEMQTDWIARLQSRQLEKTLLDAAAEGWKSEVHSTHPIPGMAYGAEFGQGLPGLEHLY